MTTVEFIEKYKIICICRKIYGSELLELAHALHDGGIRMMEVTFDQADPDCIRETTEAIRMLNDEFGQEMSIGAGTVLSAAQVEAAKDAGANYIISPNTNLSVIRRTKELGLVSIPGAMTPTEILTAHDEGADLVKLFPTVRLGTGYFKDILGPISHVKLLGTGGLTEENIKEYFDLGMVGAGISGRLVDKKLRQAGDFDQITERAKAFMRIATGG